MSDRTEIISKQYNYYSSLRKMIFDHVPVDMVDVMFTNLDAVVNTSRQVGYQHALNLLENNNPHWGGVMPVKYPEFTVDEDLQVDYNLSKMARQTTTSRLHREQQSAKSRAFQPSSIA
jgi:hypothetical protein